MRPAIAVVLAAGRGRRMAAAFNGEKAGVHKLMLMAHGRPVLAWTLVVFENHPDIERIYVTAAADEFEMYRDLIASGEMRKVSGLVPGGRERQESVHLALQHILLNDPAAPRNPLIAVHDGARPLLAHQQLSAILEAAEEEAARDPRGGALLCVPAKETLKRVRQEYVTETVPREQMMVAQTPQVFLLNALLQAHQQAECEGFVATDDACLVERSGGTVRAVVGDEENIKVTTPQDLYMLERILERRLAAPESPSVSGTSQIEAGF